MTFLEYVRTNIAIIDAKDRDKVLQQAKEIDRLEDSFEEKVLGLGLFFKMGMPGRSGNYGHAGRPGKRGGSVSGSSNMSASVKNVCDGVARAVKENPDRLYHGNTDVDAFIIVDSTVYSVKDRNKISTDAIFDSTIVHSHDTKGNKSGAFQPHSPIDVHTWLTGFKKGELGNKSAVIMSDGRMELLELSNNTSRSVFSLGLKDIEKAIFTKGTYDEARTKIKRWATEYKINYYPDLKWRQNKSIGLSNIIKMGMPGRSGNYGHAGRPGKVGGSTTTGAKRETRKGKRAGLRPSADQVAKNKINDAKTAEELGLVHATRFTDKDGKTVLKLDNGRDLPAHVKTGLNTGINAPGLEDVYVNPNARSVENGAMAFRARSSTTGDLVVGYSKEAMATKKDKTWAKVRQLELEESRITDKILSGMKSNDLDIRENAACLRLIQVSAIRAGDDLDLKYDVHGASTMQAKDVTIKGNKAIFDFNGKESIRNVITVSDPVVVADVAQRLKNPVKGFIYDTTYRGKYGLLEYTKSLNKKMNYTPKDFRTLRATQWAQAKIKSMKPPKTKKEYMSSIKEVSGYVGRLLGHQSAKDEPWRMAYNKYINPRVWGDWNKGEW